MLLLTTGTQTGESEGGEGEDQDIQQPIILEDLNIDEEY